MDAEALRRTLATGRTWFWSRSRQEYWCKGETSGDRQYVREVRYDCDGDTRPRPGRPGGRRARATPAECRASTGRSARDRPSAERPPARPRKVTEVGDGRAARYARARPSSPTWRPSTRRPGVAGAHGRHAHPGRRVRQRRRRRAGLPARVRRGRRAVGPLLVRRPRRRWRRWCARGETVDGDRPAAACPSRSSGAGRPGRARGAARGVPVAAARRACRRCTAGSSATSATTSSARSSACRTSRRTTSAIPDAACSLIGELAARSTTGASGSSSSTTSSSTTAGRTAELDARVRGGRASGCDELAARLLPTRAARGPSPLLDPAPATRPSVSRTMSQRGRYEAAVEVAKEHIAAGDVFQVVLSQRFDLDLDVDPFEVYRVLRQVNPSPYLYFLRFRRCTVVGSSPEPIVRLRDGDRHLAADRRDATAGRDRGRGPAARRASSSSTRRRSPSTSCSSTSPATTSAGSCASAPSTSRS